MKLKKNVFICCALICIYWGFLQGNIQVCSVQDNESQNKKDPTENTFLLFSVLNQLTKTHEQYPLKDANEVKIKCKNCGTRELSLHEFEGGLIGWALKSLGSDDQEFGKIKILLEDWIKLLTDRASASELVSFMLTVSNDMKQVCSNCHGIVWEK